MQSPAVPLDEVIRTEMLERRAPRERDSGAEARAMSELRRGLAGSPRALLQRLTEVALELCGAQSAGVSLLEEEQGRRFFRWHAVSGEYKRLLCTTLPYKASPCGAVLDRREALLMIDPERHYTYFAQVRPYVVEVMLVPFAVRGETVGTLWIVSHDPARRFDAEDRRIVKALTEFAAAAYERLQSFSADDVRELSRMHLDSEKQEKTRRAGF